MHGGVVEIAPLWFEERLNLGEGRADDDVGFGVRVGNLACSVAPLDGHHGLAAVEIEHFSASACVSTAKIGILVSRISQRYHFMKRGDHGCFSERRGGTGHIRQDEERGEKEGE